MDDNSDKKEFFCNVTLIKALLQFSPLSDRKRVQEWLAKLQEVEEGASDCKMRNEYSFYLLHCLQNGTLMQPFHKSPPAGKLKPLCRVVPDFIYEEIQKQLKMSYCRLNEMLDSNNDNYEMPDLRCDPAGFRSEQPRPRKGVTAMCAVFSNYEDEQN